MNKFQSIFIDEINQIGNFVEARLAGEQPSTPPHWVQDPNKQRFAILTRAFGLRICEVALLQLLIAQHMRPDLARAYEEHSGFAYVHEALVRDLFGLEPQPIYTSDSGLNIWQLVRARDMGPSAPMGFTLDLAVIEWLAGRSGLAPHIMRHLRLAPVQSSNTAARGIAKKIANTQTPNNPFVAVLTGHDGNPAELAAQVAQSLGMALWICDAQASAKDAALIHRFALVQNAALFISDPAFLTADQGGLASLIFSTDNIAQASHITTERFAIPTLQQADLYEILAHRFSDADPQSLSRVAAIKGLTMRLVNDPAHQTIADLAAKATARHTEKLRAWAVPLATNLRFDDLILPTDLKDRLFDFAEDINHRQQLWQNPEVSRLYSQERALTALLQGPPGTGKTMAAKVIAGHLGMPIYRVDAASLTSKFIGETSKNMRAMFKAVNQSGVILFVDEFEALASKRTESRNEIARSYNHDTAYFLQLIETALDGVAIFATNRPMDIDTAMMRRIRKTFDFPPPQVTERRALWHAAIAPFAPEPHLYEMSETLGEVFEFTGARIKAVILNAFGQSVKTGTVLNAPELYKAALAEAQINGRIPDKRALGQFAKYIQTEAET